MSFLTKKKQEHETQCEAAVRQDRFEQARFHAAKAAEFAYALARQTDGVVSRRYVEDAEGWLDIAERLEKAPARPSTSASARSGRATEKDTAAGEVAGDEGWLVSERPKVTFDDIAGMEQAKTAIRQILVYPLQAPEKTRLLKLPLGGGVLLYGPPGNGKTTLAKAAAHEVDADFFYASGAEIRSKWHGESEQHLRALIQAAKARPVSILFLDDVDGLLPRRGGKSAVDNRIVVQFLSEVGGFEENSNILLILGATNKPWEIDEAVFRTGRFDEKIYVGVPDVEARRRILAVHLEGVPRDPGIEPESWADRLDHYTGSDVVGVVNAAKRAALARAITAGTPPSLTEADFEGALSSIPASATPELLRRYEKFQEQRFGR